MSVFRTSWDCGPWQSFTELLECDRVEELGPGYIQKEFSSSFHQVTKETTQEMMAPAVTLIAHPFYTITLWSMV